MDTKPIFRIESLEIGDTSVGGALREAAPEPEDVAETFRQKLYGRRWFAAEGSVAIDGELNYELGLVSPQGDAAGTELLINVAATFDTGEDVETPVYLEDRAIDTQPVEDAADLKAGDIAAALERTLGRLAEILSAEALFQRATPEQMRELIEAGGLSTEEAGVAISEVRFQRLEDVAPALQRFLEHRDSKIVVDAAGTLVELGVDGVADDVLEAARHLEATDDPELVPMVSVLGLLGSDRAVAFLESMANEHANPSIREFAQMALERDGR